MALPATVHHYEEPEAVPAKIRKYWDQRHKIFSRYDEGVLMTDDAWFGVTPEPVAREIAKHVACAPAQKTVLIDAFGGAGGNVIQFALSGRWDRIFMVEKNPDVLACARRNADLYGVKNKIVFLEGDIFQMLKYQLRSVLKQAVIFGSPPWGGPSYTDFDVFDLNVMQPYSLDHLCDAFSKLVDHFILFLPRTSDLQQLADHCNTDKKIDVVHYCMLGASKGICVYYGDFAPG